MFSGLYVFLSILEPVHVSTHAVPIERDVLLEGHSSHIDPNSDLRVEIRNPTCQQVEERENEDNVLPGQDHTEEQRSLSSQTKELILEKEMSLNDAKNQGEILLAVGPERPVEREQEMQGAGASDGLASPSQTEVPIEVSRDANTVLSDKVTGSSSPRENKGASDNTWVPPECTETSMDLTRQPALVESSTTENTGNPPE